MKIKICTTETPYTKSETFQRWQHPSAAEISYNDYSETYLCPICGLKFSVELPE